MIFAIAQPQKAQGGDVYLVLAGGEVIDRVGGGQSASVVIAVAVGQCAVDERVGIGATVQGIASCATVDDVGAAIATQRVITAQAQNRVVAFGAVQRFGVLGAGEDPRRNVAHIDGKTVGHRSTGRVARSQQYRVKPGCRAARCAAEGQGLAVELQPLGQGAVIGQGRAVGQRVAVRVAEAAGLHGVGERLQLGDVLVHQRRIEHWCLIGG